MNKSTRRADDVETPDPTMPDDQTTNGPTAGSPREASDGSVANGETMPASDEVARLIKERDELRDQVLRSRAEFANYQKRAKQQADADRAYAVGSLAHDLLDSIDNLERAIEALRASGAEGITAGLDMVQKQLFGILAKHGVEPIVAQGQPFDPNLHDAIVQQPSDEHPEGTVVGEYSKGFKIHDRVLRPSKVAVSIKPAGGG